MSAPVCPRVFVASRVASRVARQAADDSVRVSAGNSGGQEAGVAEEGEDGRAFFSGLGVGDDAAVEAVDEVADFDFEFGPVVVQVGGVGVGP